MHSIRRLVAKLVVNRVSAEVATILAPHQLGVGVKLATEAAAHASRTYINNLTAGQAVSKLDFNNAFNSLHRDIMLMAVKNYLPHLRNYVELCYAQPIELYFGNEIIMSEEGAQLLRRSSRVYAILFGNSTNRRQIVIGV